MSMSEAPVCAKNLCDATGRILINRVGGQQDTAWYCVEHAETASGTTMARRSDSEVETEEGEDAT